MKNKAVQAMMAIQHNVKPEEVTIEFTYAIGSEYNFEVTIHTPVSYEKFDVKVESLPMEV
jgi:hypothetical protein